MKNQFLSKITSSLIIAFAFITFLLGACNNKDDDVDIDNPDKYKITYKADGVLQEFTSDNRLLGFISNIPGNQSCVVKGIRSEGTITIKAVDLLQPIVEQTYVANHESYTGAIIEYGDGEVYYSTSGENPTDFVKINKITEKTIEGEFHGTLRSYDKK